MSKRKQTSDDEFFDTVMEAPRTATVKKRTRRKKTAAPPRCRQRGKRYYTMPELLPFHPIPSLSVPEQG